MIPFRIHPEAALEGLAAGDSIEADDPRQAHLFHAALREH
ncbi:MAG: hypothetical protein JWO82_540 [Akkermansiaceae bacterium]|nr:hypothetical protein [Akkermansiaceae bacterium]